MKKNMDRIMFSKAFFRYAFLSVLFITIICAAGCNNLNNDGAYKKNNPGKNLIYLKVDVASASRTLLPAFTKDSISDFEFTIEGKKEDDEDFSPLKNDTNQDGIYSSLSELQNAKFPVEPGTWTFKLTANKEGTFLSDELSKTITDDDNTLSFNLKWEDKNLSGTGSFSFTFDYSAAPTKETVARVTGQLYSFNPETAEIAALEGEAYKEQELQINESSVVYTAEDVDAGNYRIFIKLYDDESNLIMRWPENAIITGGQESSRTQEVISLNPVYSIDFVYNCGNYVLDPEVELPNHYTRFTFESAFPLPAASQLTRKGYTFEGWYTDESLSGNEVTEIPAGSTDDLIYYAKWTANNYSIRYANIADEDWKDDFTPVQSYKIEDKVVLPTSDNIQRENAEFCGWYDKDPASNNLDAETAIIGWGAEDQKIDDVVLYARWKYNQPFDVQLNPDSSALKMAVTVDGAAINDDAPISAKYSATAGKRIVFTPALPEGYTCRWTVDGTTQTVGADEILTLNTAGWFPGVYDVQFIAAKGSVSESYFTQIIIKAPPIGEKESPSEIGDIVFNDGSATAYVTGMELTDKQKAAAVAVIFYKGTECSNDSSTERMLGLGLHNSYTSDYKWAADNTIGAYKKFEDIICTPSETGEGVADTATFEGDVDGSDNWAYICSQDSSAAENAATKYPAFDYVNNYAATFGLTGKYAEGWYMPSLAELTFVYRNKEKLNSALNVLGTVQLRNGIYWSSSQYQHPDSGDSAWCVKLTDGVVYFFIKNTQKSVCVIRAF